MPRIAIVSLIVLIFAAVGCGSYYIVKDPASGKSYYTTDVKQLKGGAVKLKDEKTGAEITLQSSEVKEVSSKEYKAGLKAPAAAPAAPAAK
jgi:hypothetical protein